MQISMNKRSAFCSLGSANEAKKSTSNSFEKRHVFRKAKRQGGEDASILFTVNRDVRRMSNYRYEIAVVRTLQTAEIFSNLPNFLSS